MPPVAFSTQEAFRAWLERHHSSEREIVLRCYKVHAGQKGIGYRQALDEALCFGWIDGVRRGLDEDSFTQRFTPRRPRSVWSAVNIKRAHELEAEGRMRPAGIAAFRKREAGRSGVYSFESRPAELALSHAKKLQSNKRAWTFFQKQPPWYRRTCAFWIMSAKQEQTRDRRFAILLACSARETKVPPLSR